LPFTKDILKNEGALDLRLLLLFLLVSSQLFSLSQIAQAKDENLRLQEIQTSDNFTVLKPNIIPNNMEMTIQPYPPIGYGKSTKLSMIFRKNKQFIFSIQESKYDQKVLDKDVYYYGKPVSINGYKGYFLTSGIKGGHLLIWIQDGTFLQMDGTLSEEKMVEIGKSMN
jgi:hypothetical protein